MGNVPGRFSLFHAKLRAERPRLIVLLMLAALAASRASTWAEEPVRLALVSTAVTSSISSTNLVKPAAKPSIQETNSLSLAVSQPVEKSTLSIGNALHPISDSDVQSMASVALVIKKAPEPAGFFSDKTGNGSFGFANFQAGYGQAYDCDSIVLRGRNGTAWEETRYVFFKKVVKF